MRTKRCRWLAVTMVRTGMLVVLCWMQPATRVDAAPGDPTILARTPGNRVLARALALARGGSRPAPYAQPLSAGPLHAVLEAFGALDRRAAAVALTPDAEAVTALSSLLTQGCQHELTAGNDRNIRVNQDCSLRRQAEEVLAINPTNPANLIAGYNDFRLGMNHCGYAWSFDGGQTWGIKSHRSGDSFCWTVIRRMPAPIPPPPSMPTVTPISGGCSST
jgi:hypothetical protein